MSQKGWDQAGFPTEQKIEVDTSQSGCGMLMRGGWRNSTATSPPIQQNGPSIGLCCGRSSEHCYLEYAYLTCANIVHNLDHCLDVKIEIGFHGIRLQAHVHYNELFCRHQNAKRPAIDK